MTNGRPSMLTDEPTLRAVISGAALLYLFIVGVLWCMVGYLYFGPPDAWNHSILRRRDRIALRLVYGVPIGTFVALIAFAFGRAWAGS